MQLSVREIITKQCLVSSYNYVGNYSHMFPRNESNGICALLAGRNAPCDSGASDWPGSISGWRYYVFHPSSGKYSEIC